MFDSLSRIADTLGLLLECAQEMPQPNGLVQPDAFDASALIERLDQIELGRAKWEAECEVTLMKADAAFKNARNAEERTRSMTARADEDSEDDQESLELLAAAEAWYAQNHAEGGEENGLPEVRDSVEVQPGKLRALRAKWL